MYSASVARHSWRSCCRLPPAGLVLVSVVLVLVGQEASCRHSTDQQQQRQNSIEAEYPALAAAPSNLLAESEGGALGSLAQGYLNNKRARKMSAFVPMRGRKDGRDSMMGGEQLPLLLASGGDSDNEISVVRLLAASNGQVEPSGAHWSTPRQFANQMLARHMELGEESAVAPSSSGYLGGAPMMQAKLRRAFHPMRGKRLTSLDLASLVDELQPDAWTSS